MNTANGKDIEFEGFVESFENKMELINWHDIVLNVKDRQMIQNQFSSELKAKADNVNRILAIYKNMYLGKTGYMHPRRQITYEQFLDNLEL